jgi:hypothetical protein
MTQNIGAEGAPYNTKIPALAENADIQTALRVYHYGVNTDNPITLEANSIAGFLSALQTGKIANVPVIIPNEANLDNYTTTGFYSQRDNTFASNGSSYPSLDGQKNAGMLTVINDGNIIYQTYHMSGNGSNNKFWRARFSGSWTPWREASDDTHTHDILYYRKYAVGQPKTSTVYNASEVDSIANTKVSSETTNTIFVQSTQPTEATDGDLWFW